MRDGTAHAHLTTTKDETLLWWRYTRLLLDLLLDARDLCKDKRRRQWRNGLVVADRRRRRTLSSGSMSSSICKGKGTTNVVSTLPDAQKHRRMRDRKPYLLASECLCGCGRQHLRIYLEAPEHMRTLTLMSIVAEC